MLKLFDKLKFIEEQEVSFSKESDVRSTVPKLLLTVQDARTLVQIAKQISSQK